MGVGQTFTRPFLRVFRAASLISAAAAALAPAAQTLGISSPTLAFLDAWRDTIRIPWSMLFSWLDIPFHIPWWEKVADLLALLSLVASALWAGALLELTAPAEKRAYLRQRRVTNAYSSAWWHMIAASAVAILFALDFLAGATRAIEAEGPGHGFFLPWMALTFVLGVCVYASALINYCYPRHDANVEKGDARLHRVAAIVVVGLALVIAAAAAPASLGWLAGPFIIFASGLGAPAPWTILLVYALRFNPMEFTWILLTAAAILGVDRTASFAMTILAP